VPDFKRLYLDTTVLRKSNWPHISAELSFLLESARNFEIEVFIPEVVELEREAQWLRDLTAASQKLDAAADKLAVTVAAVGAGRLAVPNRDFAALKDAYRSQSDSAKEQGGIKTVSITARTIGEFLKLAIDRTPPFQLVNDRVTGFQDTVVLLSIMDDAKAVGAETCAIVSEDDVFSKISHIARTEGISVKHFRTVNDVWKALVDEISPHVFEWWDQQRAEIRRALESQSDEIVRLLREKVTPDMVNHRVEKLAEIGTPRIDDVEMPLPGFPNEPGPYRTTEGAVFRVSAKIEVEFDTLAKPGLALFAAIFYQRIQKSAAGATEQPLPAKEEPRPETFRKRVQLEAEAAYSGGQYLIHNLQFVGITDS
jgi:hypothetical protein